MFCKNASPVLKNNIIRDNNVTGYGGGIFIQSGLTMILEQNIISNNTAEEDGGGVFCRNSSPTFIGNTISLNDASENGGGLRCYECHVVLLGNMILDNYAFNYGGVHIDHCTSVQMENNTISDSYAWMTGGVYIKSSLSVQIKGNEITKHGDMGYSHALVCNSSEGTITDNLVADNKGGGIRIDKSSFTISKNTISGNTYRGGIYICPGSDVLLEDNIISGNWDTGSFAGGVHSGRNTRVIHNIIHGNTSEEDGGGIRSIKTKEIRDNVIVENTSYGYGGGIYHVGSSMSSEMIADNTIRGNEAGFGGGICTNKSPDIIGNTISENHAESDGGGIYLRITAKPLIFQNTINDNSTDGRGGAVCSEQTSCVLIQNDISGNISQLAGGGVFCSYNYHEIRGNRFTQNISESRGGGLSILGDIEGLIQSNIITGNKAAEGGGLSLTSCYATDLSNNVIAANESGSGGGIFFDEVICELANITLCNNTSSLSGGGASCYKSYLDISNSIFWNNEAPLGPQFALVGNDYFSVIHLEHSTMKSGQAGVFVGTGSKCNWNSGMITADPQFVNSAAGDYHLMYTSPCRDAGINAGASVTEDFEGDPRIAQANVDIGADEFHCHFYCTGEFTPQGQIEAHILGIPASSPIFLALGGSLLDPPLNLSIGDFHLAAPWFLINLMATMPAQGVLILPTQLPRLPEAPYDLHMQAFVGDRLTNLFTMEVR